MSKVITGALALFKTRGIPIGYMRNIRTTENFQRVEVRGMGELVTQETPVVSFSGTISCDFFTISIKESAFPNALRRDFQNVKEWTEHILLDDLGVQLDIFKKVKDVIDDQGRIKAKPEILASIPRLYIDSNSFDIADGQASGTSQSFRFLDPILSPQ